MAPEADAARERVIDAATALFLHKGASLVTMEAVAAAAGVSRRTVSGRYFNRARLLTVVVERLCEPLDAPFEGELRSAPGVRQVLDRALAHFELMGPREAELRYRSPEAWSRLLELRRTRLLDPLARLISDAAQRGELAPAVDAHAAVRAVPAIVEAVGGLAVPSPGGLRPRATFSVLSAVLVHGLFVRKESAE